MDSGIPSIEDVREVTCPMLRQRTALASAACCLLFSGIAAVNAQDDDALTAARNLQRAFTTTIERGEKSVVGIARFKATGGRRDPNALPPENFVPNEFGSGVLITDGRPGRKPLVLTNYHLVRGGPVADASGPSDAGISDILVRFHDRRRTRASIIAADPRSDLAVLRLELGGTEIKWSSLDAFKLQTAKPFKKGHLVVTLSNPYAQSRDGSASAGWGIISNIARRLDRRSLPSDDPELLQRETIHHFGTLLQIDARLNLGASGGALLNLDGQLIGITTSLAALDGYEKSAGFAIPFDKPTRRIIDSLIEGYEVEYGFLGVSPSTATEENMRGISARFKQPTAALISKVVTNSPAAVAGLHRDDIVLRVNEVLVFNQYDLMREVAMLGPGAIARLRIWPDRERKERTLFVKLGKWPVVDEEGIISTRTRLPPWRGLSVDYPTARWKHLPYQLDRYYRAVLVTKVAEDSAAANRKVGIRSGDYITHVNQTAVTTPAEFERLVSRLSGSVTLNLADGRRVVLPAQ
jgi:serine protease Do